MLLMIILKIDNWSPASYRLLQEIDTHTELSDREKEDIRFVQEQVRNFAQIT